jgi:hypothetical protein
VICLAATRSFTRATTSSGRDSAPIAPSDPTNSSSCGCSPPAVDPPTDNRILLAVADGSEKASEYF